ncbi:hypothetical protein PACTADRAFT_49424 [Pachysolen tannophilus NRRL Y-2460]|uniref:Protein AF-9 homolog n=1 Tax=Pachysolen tannophilus NRRL Y-2460 TaxID=669874 RepID=A0A1E4TW39_PACTA|nr:hypothetical protein PACTADRAFT_49424 [Pachysolen tannophilus NRRL Y-2460]
MAPPSTNSRRLKNITISRPIIYGNTATPLTSETRTPSMPTDHTHLWTVFVRDPTGGDLSYMIKKVVFKLHDTYPNATRSIEAPPFEVVESGWGEFEIGIKIFFISESSEKNISIFHHLKLHPYGIDPAKLTEADKNHVESIMYDELVFNEPTDKMFEVLTSRPGSMLPIKSTKSTAFSRQVENDELDRINIGIEKIVKELEEQREKIKLLEEEKNKLIAES